jgi:hypothetical protein
MRRTVYCFTILSLLVFVACGWGKAKEKKLSTNDLPKAVLVSFQKSYPAAKIKSASTETARKVAYFEIESVDGVMHRDIRCTADGTVAEIERSTVLTDAP